MKRKPTAASRGTDIVPAPQKGEIIAPLSHDERHREAAVESLSESLDEARALLARCTAMANAKRGDRLGPVYAAAKLMQAHAQIARALAHVALVERRSRTIVETIQPRAAKNPELNSAISYPPGESPKEKLLDLIKRLLEQARSQKKDVPPPGDSHEEAAAHSACTAKP